MPWLLPGPALVYQEDVHVFDRNNRGDRRVVADDAQLRGAGVAVRHNPIRSAALGVIAGAAGTLAMDAVWYRRYRRGGGESGFADWEFARGTTKFEDAAAPAQVGRKIAKWFGVSLGDDKAALTTNVMHWATGAQWGGAYGAVAGSMAAASPVLGVPLGLIACGTSYVVLPKLDLYKPIWEYDAKTLAKDFSAHLVFGVTTAAVFRALAIAT